MRNWKFCSMWIFKSENICVLCNPYSDACFLFFFIVLPMTAISKDMLKVSRTTNTFLNFNVVARQVEVYVVYVNKMIMKSAWRAVCTTDYEWTRCAFSTHYRRLTLKELRLWCLCHKHAMRHSWLFLYCKPSRSRGLDSFSLTKNCVDGQTTTRLNQQR